MGFSISDLSSSTTAVFRCPVSYASNKFDVSDEMMCELELVSCSSSPDEDGDNVYTSVLAPTQIIDKEMTRVLVKTYTTDIGFLKHSQSLLQSNSLLPVRSDEMLRVWMSIHNETSFHDKYCYLDIDRVKFLNKHAGFVQFMSMYNILSPIMSLCMPILILIVPFIVLYMRGVPITITDYVSVVRVILKNHSVGKLLSGFGSADVSQQMYMLFSVCIYAFSIYQNFATCNRFYSNLKQIHTYIGVTKEYISQSIASMNSMSMYIRDSISVRSKPGTAYSNFHRDLCKHIGILSCMYDRVSSIGEMNVSVRKCSELGQILTCFYELYDNRDYVDSMVYSFGFSGYINNMISIQSLIYSGYMNYAKFAYKVHESGASMKCTNMVYPPFVQNDDVVKNTIRLNNNMIITGPNASGKTTILKSIVINVLFSQQFGCGCYDEMAFVPYEHIHCYINIPDTMGRDSLFQAEARRCKHIIDACNFTPKHERHLCIFDELYSGTNPEEASQSAIALLKYLSTRANVNFVLTTHYKQISKFFERHVKYKSHNYRMFVERLPDHSLLYKYSIQKGVSNIKGGLNVLRDMQYPNEILSFIANKQ